MQPVTAVATGVRLVLKIFTILVSILFIAGCNNDDNIDGSLENPLLADVTWNLISYGYEGESTKALLPGTKYSIIFDSDSRSVGGTIDCNHISSSLASYTADDTNIEISSFFTTLIGCSGMQESGYKEQNDFIVNALLSLTEYSIEDSELTLKSIDSSLLKYSNTN